MQLRTLLGKDLSALFKQKAVIFSLLFPTILIIFIGILPVFIDQSEPFKVGYFIQDNGITLDNNSTLNLGNEILAALNSTFSQDESLVLVELSNYSAFLEFENALYIPKNFTYVANYTRIATYYITMSDSNIRSSPIMTGTIAQIIDSVVTDKLLPVVPPVVHGKQVFSQSELLNGNAKNRGAIAFPLAYIAFLILIMGSSSMRLTGFSAEREADMMELLLSSVIKRSEMILSKLITGVLYGFASVSAYLLGILVVVLANFGINDPEIELFSVPTELITFTNTVAVIFLFVILSFMSMEFLLAMQLVLGREAGDRFGSTGLMLMTILFYATSITDPLAESPIQIVNPFFWAFKVTLNVIFHENLLSTVIYLIAILWFSIALLVMQTRAIEKEHVIFE